MSSWSRLHPPPRQIRTLHPTHGPPLQESQRHAPRAQRDGADPNHQREEEPAEPNVHAAGRADKGHDCRGQRLGAGDRDRGREGGVGAVGAGDE